MRCGVRAYDVIVAGLGGMGSSAAYHLAARGRRVLGLERFGPAHDQGASHGGSRITRQSYFEDPAYVPLLLRAYELWDKLARDSGRDLITLTGGLMAGRPDSVVVAGSLRSAREWGLPHELLDAAEIRRRYPLFRPEPDEVALYEDKAGLVRPEATVEANLALAAGLGAELRFHEPVVSWSADGAGVAVRTAAGTYRADALVVCPGPWASRLLADLGLPLVVERHVQFWFAPRGGVEPFLPARQPIYIWEQSAGIQVYGFPALDGPDGGVKVAFFRRGEVTTPDTIDRAIRPREIEDMAAHLEARLPDAAGRFLRAKACMYTNTPDEHFVIARHPAHERVTVACGFSGHGFKFVPVVGEILADLALTGSTPHPIALFDPARAALTAPR
ncbi:N-methyl-L-tryptophan oxidase [Pseudofrankia inefficax]|uniref:N-methyl-L-tryptophan oxidase n=1 Tax=Pseudofrankia inefficax (strain DSM 45817 / CECT 9037 / DDB 130130 / EuI1c) TaxID=298654 RepID=UPI00059B6128